MPTSVTVLVGTTKGVFLLRSDDDRATWQTSGPHCDGWAINHVLANPHTGTIWAAGGNEWQGAGVWRSVDSGNTWAVSRLATGKFDEMLANDPGLAAYVNRSPAPPAPFTGQIDALWSLGRAGDTLYAGAKPAALYASHDDGENWALVEGLANHPSSDSWEPGGAGLVLHSIVADPSNPAKLWIGISAAGVFATEDGGATWDRRNRLSNSDAHGHDHGDCGHDVGHCVHNIVRAPGQGGDLMYQQNHHGVFRSPDGGRSWHDISAGLPSRFGFPIAVDPQDARRIWTLPLNGDTLGRYPPNASAAVWRSDDGGDTWQATQDGLPTANCFFTVLRQAMATDHATATGVYFGTNSGSIFATLDHGTTWHEIARHLPTVLSVETLTHQA